MKNTSIFLLSICFITSYAQNNALTKPLLLKNFKNPPNEARPKVYWWWLNGYTDPVRMKEELVAIKNAGLGGVDIFEIGLPPASDPNQIIPSGPAFMGDSSLKAIKFAIDEAGKLGLEVGLNLASSWNAGGTWVTPKHSAKTLYFSKIAVTGDAKQSVKLPFPTITPDKQGKPRPIVYGADGKPAYYEEVAVLALPAGVKTGLDTTQIINVTAFFDPKKEQLTWDAPKGNWEIYRYICSNSGEQLIRPTPRSVGPIIDHFDSSATQMHVMYFIDRLKPLLGDFSKSALKNLYLASYEAKEFTWTPTLPAAFKKLNGYDLYKFLPAIFNKEWYSSTAVNPFQFDFDHTLSELMINNHYRKAKEICNHHGLKIISEAGGPGHLHHIPVETLKALGSLDVPRGEFWYNRTFFDKDSIVDLLYLVKEIAAASHIYKRGIVEEEAFTSYWDWQEGPANLKPLADRAFCEGMNRLVIHGFTHNPTGMGYPGIAYFAGTHYNDRQAWWPKIKPFNDYLSRISYILQKADFMADVLYYYGDAIPNLVPPKNSTFKVGEGFDYEIINTEVLLKDLTVENGEWVLPQVGRFKVLSLGKGEKLNPEAMLKLKKLQKQGGIITGMNVREKLAIPPDFSYANQQKGELDYIHYAKNGLDFYLVRNTTDQWVSHVCAFRQSEKIPEIWDPVSGNSAPITVYEQVNNQIKLPISLPPYGSYFVVFSTSAAKPHFNHLTSATSTTPRLEYTSGGFYLWEEGKFEAEKGVDKTQIDNKTIVQALNGPWKLSFPKGWAAPESVTFPQLISWSKAKQPGVCYFSGTAVYQQTFQFNNTPSSSSRIYLDLGKVAEVGEVWLNGKSAGIVWTPPYRVDITDVVKSGSNTLKIEVANTWSNRLTGDGITGEKYTKTNITKANKNLVPWEQLPLKESGLLGPVTIQVIKTIR
ncbi:glycosyl hydrolase [Runella sp.]|uniref:glycosyl hydrolase n=1 Tax=Runella sp. TaxID=1960881 RepID=UPI003D142BFB